MDLELTQAETLVADSEDQRILLRLEKKRGRWGGQPHLRYRFVPVNSTEGENDEA